MDTASLRMFYQEPPILDRDGDGVLDEEDLFPDDPEEWADLDGDGVGDHSDPDLDGDGVDNDNDTFPNDASKSSDLDGDGIDDNNDPDIDGDGVNNEEDAFPNDPNRTLADREHITSPASLTTVDQSPITVTETETTDSKVTSSNSVDCHQPGEQLEKYSFDRDYEELIAIGLNTVEPTGSVLKSHPGVGVIKADWLCNSGMPSQSP